VSRPLVLLAAALFFACGLLPIASMFARLTPGDFQSLLDGRTLTLLGRTIVYGLSASALAVIVGVPFGWLAARGDVPAAGVLRPLGVLPLILPPLVIAMTWTAMAELRGPLAATLFAAASTFPLVALFCARAAERIDARMEDAARLAGGRRALLRMHAPLIAPSAMCGGCLAFVFTVNDFSIPDYVSWVGETFSVYAADVFAAWRLDQQPGRAVAKALPLVALTLASLLPALALRRRGALTAVVSGFRAGGRIGLGAWRWPAFGFCAAVVLLAGIVPIARLLWEAGGGARSWSGANLSAAFGRALELAREDLQNSVLWSAAAATLCLPLALVLGHALERMRRGRWLEPVFLLPIAVPAILFGIGMIVTWNHDWSASFYDGGGLVILLYVGRFGVFALLAMSAAVSMLDRDLERAGQLAGARPTRRLFSIVAPSLRPALVGGWVLVFVFAMRELDAAILVPAANHTAIFRVFNALHFGRDDFVAALTLLVVFLLVVPGLIWSVFSRSRMEVLP
jgi:iron(III) transport system permease protein